MRTSKENLEVVLNLIKLTQEGKVTWKPASITDAGYGVITSYESRVRNTNLKFVSAPPAHWRHHRENPLRDADPPIDRQDYIELRLSVRENGDLQFEITDVPALDGLKTAIENQINDKVSSFLQVLESIA